MTLKLTLQTLTDNILNHIVHKSSADFYLSENLKVSDNENGNTQVQVPQTCAYVQYLSISTCLHRIRTLSMVRRAVV